MLVLDEADYVIRPACIKLLHSLRDLFDQTGCQITFTSIAQLARLLAAPGSQTLVAAIASRVGAQIKFERATLADAELLARELLEDVTFDRDLIADCLARARGSIHALLALYNEIEQSRAARESRA